MYKKTQTFISMMLILVYSTNKSIFTLIAKFTLKSMKKILISNLDDLIDLKYFQQITWFRLIKLVLENIERDNCNLEFTHE